jgi:pimeloyl-ACP methyl ester carboxylesterase
LTPVTNNATSADGTSIAYDRTGEGPALVLVVGAFCTRQTTQALTPMLASHFTVYEYDRRGRGDSGDTPPYAIEREIEDLDAVIGAAGGSAMVYGHSSGAVLALVAAAKGLAITRVVAYEPPLFIPPVAEVGDLAAALKALADQNRPGDAAELFLTVAAGAPPEIIAMIKGSPDWAGMESVAHTLWYDATIAASESEADLTAFESITVPTILVDGGRSAPWARHATDLLAKAVPNAIQVTVDDADHRVPEHLLAPMLIEHLG